VVGRRWRAAHVAGPAGLGDTLPPMSFVLAAATTQRRHMQEIGFLIAAAGGVAVVLSGVFGLRSMSRMTERSTMVVAGVLLTVGLVMQFFALHSGGK